MSDRLVSASQLRAWAQAPGPGGYVPVHPETLRQLADWIEVLQASEQRYAHAIEFMRLTLDIEKRRTDEVIATFNAHRAVRAERAEARIAAALARIDEHRDHGAPMPDYAELRALLEGSPA